MATMTGDWHTRPVLEDTGFVTCKTRSRWTNSVNRAAQSRLTTSSAMVVNGGDLGDVA